MTSRWPYWCPKTMKRRSCWCPKPVPWELNSFLMQTLSFVPINLHRCWPCEWKRSIDHEQPFSFGNHVIDSWRYDRTCTDSGRWEGEEGASGRRGGEPQAWKLNIKMSTWNRKKSQEEAQKSQKIARIGKLKNLKTDYFQINFKNSEPTFFQRGA